MARETFTTPAWAGWAMALCAWAGVAAAGAEGLRLDRRARVEVGDRFELICRDQAATRATGQGGRLLRDARTTTDANCLVEVLRVDETGPVELRFLLRSLRHDRSVRDALGADGNGSTLLANIHGLARRGPDGRFRFDPTRWRSFGNEPLCAPQVSVLRAMSADPLSLPAPPSGGLMPPRPVRPGDAWTPPASSVSRFAEAFGLEASNGRLVRASVRLDRVEGRTATVSGRVELLPAAPSDGNDRATIEALAKIDLATGLWLGRSVGLSARRQAGETTLTVLASRLWTASYLPGDGNAAPAPPDGRDVGGARARADTNRWTLPAEGVSLDVPEAFEARVDRGATVTVRFVHPAGPNIKLRLREVGRLAEFAPAARRAMASLQAQLPDLTVVRTETLTLAGGVPAREIVVEGHDGKVAVVTILALDGSRVVTCAAACAADDAETRRRLARRMRTLRLGEIGD